MDKASFTAALERYQDMVYRVALHVLASQQDAEDAVQEVFLRDVLRSPWRKRRAPLEELPAPPVFQAPEQQALYQAVLALPEIYRIVLELFYYEELSVREIGQLLELESSAVTTRLSRARAKLKQQLGEVWQDE